MKREINYLNLKKMFNHILLNVPEEMINMRFYRDGEDNEKLHECKSTGCIIGHCTILDNYENIPKKQNFEGVISIRFTSWSEQFTGLSSFSDNWNWCFGQNWPNNKEQILLRIKYLIDNRDTPLDWLCNHNYILPIKKLEPYRN